MAGKSSLIQCLAQLMGDLGISDNGARCCLKQHVAAAGTEMVGGYLLMQWPAQLMDDQGTSDNAAICC